MSRADFDREIGDGFTLGNLISATFRIDNDVNAVAFYEGYVDFLHEHVDDLGGYTPEQVARQNIGWCFGEGMSDERRAMWVRAVGASHPVFGTMSR